MSLATRCSSCNTVFRVVQDQLKVSEGWVRCGRCHEVFNALESLFDLDRADAALEAPPAATSAPAADTPAGAASETDGGAAASEPAAPPPPLSLVTSSPSADPEGGTATIEGAGPVAEAETPEAAETIETTKTTETADAAEAAEATDATEGAEAATVAEVSALQPAAPNPPAPAVAPAPLPAWPPPSIDATTRSGFSAAHDTPASRLDARDRNDFEDARFNSELFADEVIVQAPDAPEPSIGDVVPGDAAEATPEFLRRAEQRARWDKPAVSVALALVCGVLLLALAGQVAHHFRDLIAATYPQTRPALAALCEMAGCRIEPLRRIDAIVIESSALTSAPTGNAIRLSVVLRNRGTLPLAMPAIDLSLTDPGGQLLARRALLPADFGKADATLAANAETPLQLVLAVEGRRPSGYTVEPFYP